MIYLFDHGAAKTAIGIGADIERAAIQAGVPVMWLQRLHADQLPNTELFCLFDAFIAKAMPAESHFILAHVTLPNGDAFGEQDICEVVRGRIAGKQTKLILALYTGKGAYGEVEPFVDSTSTVAILPVCNYRLLKHPDLILALDQAVFEDATRAVNGHWDSIESPSVRQAMRQLLIRRKVWETFELAYAACAYLERSGTPSDIAGLLFGQSPSHHSVSKFLDDCCVETGIDVTEVAKRQWLGRLIGMTWDGCVNTWTQIKEITHSESRPDSLAEYLLDRPNDSPN